MPHIEKPWIIMHQVEDKVECVLLNPSDKPDPENLIGFEKYALLACDLIRHIARAFGVEEEDVWDWVERERYHPTTKVERKLQS